MSNPTLILSLGLFARLSCLSAQRERLIEGMIFKYNSSKIYRQKPSVSDDNLTDNEDNNIVDKNVNKERILKLIYKTFFYLLEDLNALVESIILSEKILFFAGHKRVFPALDEETVSIVSNIMPTFKNMFLLKDAWHPGWNSFHYFDDEAYKLINLIIDNIESEHVLCGDDTLNIVSKLLDFTFTYSYRPNQIIFSKEGSFYEEKFNEVLRSMLYYERYPYFINSKYLNDLLQFVDNFLGENWKIFKEVVSKRLSKIPSIFFTSKFHSLHEEIGLSKLAFTLALFSEMILSLEKSGIVLPTWNSNEYYLRTGNISHCHILNLYSLPFKSYNKSILEQLEKYGICNIEYRLPQLIRACLVNANSINQIIENALRIREKSWSKNFRSYIAELALEYRPDKILRVLNRLHSYIERHISDQCPTGIDNLTLTSTGAIGIPLKGLIEKLSIKRNPVILFNKNIFNLIGKSDSVLDFSRILSISPDKIINYLKKSQSRKKSGEPR